jgi:D-alanyl-D-alanine carboxypeptidase
LLGRFAGTDGIKTGYIRASGFNLTSSAQRGDKRIIGVVMGASSGAARNKYMMTMLAKAFPQCKEGRTLASAVQGAGPASATALAAVAPAKSLPVLAAAKPEPAADPKLVMPDPIPSDFVTANAAPDSEAAAEEDTAQASAADEATFTALDPPPAETVQPKAETKAGAQDSAKIVIASTAPAANLPFGVKKNAPGAGGVVIVPDTSSTWKIQIGAYPNKSEAQAILYKVRSMDAQMFGGKPAFTVQVQLGTATMYRARLSGFSEELARAACKRLSTKGIGCVALSPQS